MPSRPMLTTPARSEKSPPRAASSSGVLSSRAAVITDDEVSAFSPLTRRATENSTISPATPIASRPGVPVASRRRSGEGRPAPPAAGSGVVTDVLTDPPPVQERNGAAVLTSASRGSLRDDTGDPAGGHRVLRWRARGLPAGPLGGPAGDPAGDLVGDHDGQHDRPLDDRDHRGRQARRLQRHRRPVEERV